MTNDTPDERQLTTDRERIRAWADERDAVPVVHGEHHRRTFVHRDDVGNAHEEQTWDEFFEGLEDDDLVFVYHEEEPRGDDLGFFELVERGSLVDRARLEHDELESRLLEGETVTTELVETRTVEREIVETDTIETELVDSEIVSREIVDGEVVDREIVETKLIDDETIEAVLEETRYDTIEEIERLTVESRVVDVDIETHDEVDAGEVRSTIADETIQRSILESDLVRTSGDVDEVLSRGDIRTQRTEGDVVESHLVERRTVEEKVHDRRRMTYTLAEAEVIETEVTGSELLEAEIVDVEEYAISTDKAEAEPMGTEAVTEGTETGAETEAAAGTTSGPVELSTDDQGKDVVSESGEQVGIVADVEGEMLFIDPEPGLTDRLRARFDWGEPDKDAYPVNVSQVREITDDEVVLKSE
ncbi:hypothetical protein ACYJ1Y_09165 [Natrialbaceae archaeon A-gly3]